MSRNFGVGKDDDDFEDDPWMRQFLAGQQAKEDRSRSLAWGCIPLVILIPILILLAIAGARAADRPEKPDAWFCIKARAAVLATGSEKAAEDEARARGASEATIAKAKRCSR